MKILLRKTDVKKTLTRYGSGSVFKSHRYLQSFKTGFGISPCMQELMVYAGHLDCYGRCEETLEKYTLVKVSPYRVYRLTDHLSESLRCEDRKIERTLQPLSKQDVLYVETAR